MSRVRPSSPPTGLLAAAVTATATSFTFPSGTYTAMDRPRQMYVSSTELVNVTAVATGSPETWTVVRGVEGTTAVPHDLDATVERVYPLSEVVYTPEAVLTTVPTGTPTYTPDVAFKYHFLTLGGSTKLTIPAPISPVREVERGQELRLHFTITSTALSNQPTWSAVYDRALNSTTQGTIVLTANARSSMSFAYAGPTAMSTNAWRRIG